VENSESQIDWNQTMFLCSNRSVESGQSFCCFSFTWTHLPSCHLAFIVFEYVLN